MGLRRTVGTMQLRELDVGGVSKLSDSALGWMGEGMRMLQRLTMPRCVQVTELGFETLVDRFPRLQALELARCAGLTSKVGGVVSPASSERGRH
jgi:hypothetical protein